MGILMDHSSKGVLLCYLDKWRLYRNIQVRSSLPAPCWLDGTVHMQFRVVAEEVPLFGTVIWACRLCAAPGAGDRTAFENVTVFSREQSWKIWNSHFIPPCVHDCRWVPNFGRLVFNGSLNVTPNFYERHLEESEAHRSSHLTTWIGLSFQF